MRAKLLKLMHATWRIRGPILVSLSNKSVCVCKYIYITISTRVLKASYFNVVICGAQRLLWQLHAGSAIFACSHVAQCGAVH